MKSLPETCYFRGVPVVSVDSDYVLAEMEDNIAGVRENSIISITNTEYMYYAVRGPELREHAIRARFSLCDGMGVVLAGLAHGKRICRLNGPVLMEACCEFGVAKGWRHFFYGGRPGVPELLREKLTARFPGIVVAGCYTPPQRPVGYHEDEAVLERVQSARPDILWVGLGLPKQQVWINDHIERLRVPWLIGIGAAFDYHAGTAKWAPRPVRRLGLEWLYRLCHEPRMLKRNARSFAFLGESLFDGIRARGSAKTPQSSLPLASDGQSQNSTAGDGR